VGESGQQDLTKATPALVVNLAKKAANSGAEDVKALLLSLPSGSNFDEAIGILAKALAATPADSVGWVLQNREDLGRHMTYQLVPLITHHWSLQEPIAAMKFVAAADIEANLKRDALATVLSNAFASKGKEAYQFFETLYPGETGLEFLIDNGVLRAWAASDLDSLCEFSYHQAPQFTNQQKKLVGEALSSSSFFPGASAVNIDKNILEFAFRSLVTQDANKTLSALERLPKGDARDGIIQAIWPNIYAVDPGAAQAWIASISNETTRANTLEQYQNYPK
jgi:hypothetical protein